MDEGQWAEGSNLDRMIDQLTRFGRAKGKSGHRRMRLYACACCRRIWHLLSDQRSRDAVLVSERFGEGLASVEELIAAREAAQAASLDQASAPSPFDWRSQQAAWRRRLAADAAHSSALPDHVNAARLAGEAAKRAGWMERLHFQCEYLRDVFGSPFRSVAVDPSWRTPAVLALAQAAYENRTFPAGTLEPDRLAVLADALEEAGCDNSELLGHLRGPGPHVRGCHVVDLLLAKE